MAPLSRPILRRAGTLGGIAILGAAFLVAGPQARPAAAAGDEVTLLFGTPSTLDPARQGDIGSAAYSAQLFESLTAFDAQLTLQPALAKSWDISDDGTHIVFHLRSGLEFSDGSPITGTDVVESWLRVIDPRHPSQLSSLLADVKGAADYLAGRITNPADVGLSATGNDVTVELVRAGADFPSIVAGPTFGVVPRVVRDDPRFIAGSTPSSGAYVLADVTQSEYTLTANDHYWAGSPAIKTAHLLQDIGGRSPVAAFEAGDVDLVGIDSFDAAWIKFDGTLGPQLRVVPSLALSYVGFTTTVAPFDDVRVRQAFGAAVDWRRLVELGAGGAVPATSMVPPGIKGAGDRNWMPAYDPDRARSLLADAGYPGGQGFPDVVFASGGLPYAEGIQADLERELGVHVQLEELLSQLDALDAAPPQMWTLGWIADYPGPNDFLGVLLSTGSSNNYGGWTSPDFDSAIGDALSTRDAPTALTAYERALGVVQDQVPTIPINYGDGWALSRNGLLGAGQNGLGILRIAGLAWQ